MTHPASWSGQPKVEVENCDFRGELRALLELIYKEGNPKSRTRAMLCHITSLALHDDYREAHALLLMSHLQVKQEKFYLLSLEIFLLLRRK